MRGEVCQAVSGMFHELYGVCSIGQLCVIRCLLWILFFNLNFFVFKEGVAPVAHAGIQRDPAIPMLFTPALTHGANRPPCDTFLIVISIHLRI